MCGMPPAGLIPKCPQPGPSFGTGRGKTLDAGARSPERGILGTQRDARTGGCGIIITLEIDVDDVLSLEFLTLSGLKPRDKDGAMIEITFVLPALHRGDDHPHALCGSVFHFKHKLDEIAGPDDGLLLVRGNRKRFRYASFRSTPEPRCQR